MTQQNRYSAIIAAIFMAKYRSGDTLVSFQREDIVGFSATLGIPLPRNVGDVIYSFRYRVPLPEAIRATAPAGTAWIIRPGGRSVYNFALVSDIPLTPNPNLAAIRVPDATPGIIGRYALNDEQAVLARVRYNRLIDVFLGLSCYSLQNHLRTAIRNVGQIETDELYIGLNKAGAHFVIPVQAKSGHDQLSRVQVEQDLALCAARFPNLICRPIGVHELNTGIIALLKFVEQGPDIRIASERHYTLVPSDEISDEDLAQYRVSPDDRN